MAQAKPRAKAPGAVLPAGAGNQGQRLANAHGTGDLRRVIPLFAAGGDASLPILVFGSRGILDFVWIVVMVEDSSASLHYFGRMAKNRMRSAATTTIPTMPRIRGRLDFLAGAGAEAMFGMAG
jgi:hypothetical protein